MTDTDQGNGQDEGFDPNQDHYPDIAEVISTALQDEEFPQGPVDRFEVTCLANGEANWRAWPARAEEPAGGFYASELSG